MPGVVDLAVSLLPMAVVAAVSVVPWELWCAAGVVVSLVFFVEEVRAHLAKSNWEWEGKRVAVARCGSGDPLLEDGLRQALHMKNAVVAPRDIFHAKDTPAALDAAVLLVHRPNKQAAGGIDIGAWRRWTEVTPRSVEEYFHPFSEMFDAVQRFVTAHYAASRQGVLVVMLDGAPELSGHSGAEAIMASWGAFGFLEGLRAELRRTHPQLFVTIAFGELATPQKTITAVLDGAHAYHRLYLPPKTALARGLFLLPPRLQAWAAARLAVLPQNKPTEKLPICT